MLTFPIGFSAGLRALAWPIALAAGSFAPAVEAAPAITPKATIVLFNGKDLTNFYTWVPASGRHQDPDRVFTVVDCIDGQPAIRSSGQFYGGVVTREEYANYRLVLEFRWGLATWGARKDRTRDAGLLLHCTGEDGNYAKAFDGAWTKSVEYQIIDGGTGDMLLVGGFDRAGVRSSPEMMVAVEPGKKVWSPTGTLTKFVGGRLDWQYRDPAWKDVLGFRGPRDVEKPSGQWNKIEVICRGGDVVYFFNGVKVNEGLKGSLTQGKILSQSEGAEIFYCGIELHPLSQV